MKKIIKWLLIGFSGFIFLVFLVGIFADTEKPKTESLKESKEIQKAQVENQEIKEDIIEEEKVFEEQAEKARTAILSGKDPDSSDIISDINVWEEAGSGGPDNMAIGDVPHNTEVEVLESKETEGYVFYKIRSSVGNVSVLPTDYEARAKAMDERPKEEWAVPADPSFLVEGWVSDAFITGLE